MKNSTSETVDQFLERGGKVDYLPPAEPSRATQVSLQELEKEKTLPRKIARMKVRGGYDRQSRTPHL